MRIHFIGIGGIGVSALAQYYLARGHQVSGSDLVGSEMTDFLKKKGVKIFIGPHKPENLTKIATARKVRSLSVVYSAAVQKDNPALKTAREQGIKCQSYPEALGGLTKQYYTVAVSGTHGKSTVTAMLALILIKAGLDPTVILGTKLKEFGGSNFRFGKSKYLLIEADEWQAAFLNYWPQIIVLTNIEKEHLDYYKDLKHILRTYKEFVRHLPEKGALIINPKSEILNSKQIRNSKFQIRNFSSKQKETKKLRQILKVPGEHNVLNALAALAAARVLEIPDKISFEALGEYQGAWRRFEEIDRTDYTIISDYAHHPTEVAATLKAAREKYPEKKIWCLFQPHQYQRTFYLFDEFVRVFREAPVDKIIITDIYDVAGRESQEISKKVDAKKLVKLIGKVRVGYLAKERIVAYLKKHLPPDAVVIVMGAGDIYKLIYQF